ncbi:F-box domain-containing protein [Favolaschia claudopus]|uniref:F-box domain-containing protein n=1 Tax=Favolaschia claudopus TaxID=2862362 RepID=A0AAV9ZDL8_9AGAR
MILDRGARRLAKKDLKILDLEAEMAAIANRLSVPVLRLEKLEIENRPDSSTLAYPVLTLPNEITVEIFLRFLPSYPYAPPMFGLLSPILLTKICRQWREIALATPMLWRAISLPQGWVVDADRIEAAASAVSLWLSRSGNFPLSLHMFDHDDALPIILALTPHLHRAEHLSFRDANVGHLSVIDIPMPMLRSLCLHFEQGVFTGHPLTFRSLPLLRSVELDDDGVPSVILPWSQLTSLALKNLYVDVTVSLLRETPRLVDCTLNFWNRPDQFDFTPLSLPHLKTLILDQRCDANLSFLYTLATPALVSLQLPERFLVSPYSDPIPSLEVFLTNSGCRLQQLKLFNPRFSRAAYRTAFPSIASIE